MPTIFSVAGVSQTGKFEGRRHEKEQWYCASGLIIAMCEAGTERARVAEDDDDDDISSLT